MRGSHPPLWLPWRPARLRADEGARHFSRLDIPWRLHARINSARRFALVAVAAFELTEVVVLWRRGFGSQEWMPLVLGALVLLLLLGFELAEAAATRRERELALEIAEWLIPRVSPSIPHLEVAFSVRRMERVAGDYFSIVPRWSNSEDGGAHRVFVTMADVAGLGMQGALLMATFQASLRALADTRMPLGDLAAQLNRWSWDRSREGRHFVMGFFADLQPETGEIKYVNAGHQPPLLLRADGHAESLESGGIPLGVQAQTGYEVGSAVMAPGESLVIFTDGAAGARDHRGEPFGAERIRGVLENIGQCSSSEVLDLILTSVLSFAGSAHQEDDISVLVLKRV